MEEREIGDLLAAAQLLARQLAQGFVNVAIVGTNGTAAIDHFVESVIKLVFVERSRKRMLGGNPCHGASSNRIAFDEEALARTQL